MPIDPSIVSRCGCGRKCEPLPFLGRKHRPAPGHTGTRRHLGPRRAQATFLGSISIYTSRSTRSAIERGDRNDLVSRHISRRGRYNLARSRAISSDLEAAGRCVSRLPALLERQRRGEAAVVALELARDDARRDRQQHHKHEAVDAAVDEHDARQHHLPAIATREPTPHAARSEDSARPAAACAAPSASSCSRTTVGQKAPPESKPAPWPRRRTGSRGRSRAISGRSWMASGDLGGSRGMSGHLGRSRDISGARVILGDHE